MPGYIASIAIDSMMVLAAFITSTDRAGFEYLRFKLSLRDLAEMMAERGLSLAHTTIMRWVQYYTPEFEKRWRRYALALGRSWRVDETYVKIRGKWCYLYRAVDREGRTVDFRLNTRRDLAAAKAFFRKAMKSQQPPGRDPIMTEYVVMHALRFHRDMPGYQTAQANREWRRTTIVRPSKGVSDSSAST